MSTKVQIVDENDNPIGGADQKYAFENGLIRRVVRILLVHNGSIFLQKRSASEMVFPNLWDQSAGGHVDEGETYEVAARRELLEELGLEVESLNPIDKFYLEAEYKGRIARSFNMVFVGEYNNQEIKINPDEIAEARWFKIDEVSNLINSSQNFTPGFVYTWTKLEGIIRN